MLKRRMLFNFIIVIVIGMLLVSCKGKPSIDPNQKMTEVAATVQAGLTQAAASNPTATPTLEPTATATPSPQTPTPLTAISSPVTVLVPTQPQTSTADNALFITDVTYPDGSVVKPGEHIVKTWKLQNTGKTTWTKEYSVLYLEGVLYGAGSQLMFRLPAEVKPGDFAEISVPFIAPTTPGNYGSFWKMYNSSGYVFGDPFNISIIVGEPTPTGNAPTATITPAIPGTVSAGWGTP